MDNFRDRFGLLFILIFGVLGWGFGRTYHDSIADGDSVHLPKYIKWLGGNPNSDGVYNIRGIYFQLFVVSFLLLFVLNDFRVISRQHAFLFLFASMVFISFLELLRYIAKRLK